MRHNRQPYYWMACRPESGHYPVPAGTQTCAPRPGVISRCRPHAMSLITALLYRGDQEDIVALLAVLAAFCVYRQHGVLRTNIFLPVANNQMVSPIKHGRASWLAQSGVSLFALKEMGGWENLEMVLQYAHLSAGYLTEHAREIDSIIGRNVTDTAQEENVIYMSSR